MYSMDSQSQVWINERPQPFPRGGDFNIGK